MPRPFYSDSLFFSEILSFGQKKFGCNGAELSWVWRSDNLDNIGELFDEYDDDKYNVKGSAMLKLMMTEIVAMIHKTSQLGGCGGAGWPGKG